MEENTSPWFNGKNSDFEDDVVEIDFEDQFVESPPEVVVSTEEGAFGVKPKEVYPDGLTEEDVTPKPEEQEE